MGDSHAREYRRRKGLANYRLVRYADDWVVLVAGQRADAERLREEAATVLLPMGLRLSEEKTRSSTSTRRLLIWACTSSKRRRGQGFRGTYPVTTVAGGSEGRGEERLGDSTTRSLSQPRRVQMDCEGMVSTTATRCKASSYLTAFTWRRVWIWLRHKHPKATVKELRRCYLPGWHPQQDEARLFYPESVAIVRYRYRGTTIASPWATKDTAV